MRSFSRLLLTVPTMVAMLAAPAPGGAIPFDEEQGELRQDAAPAGAAGVQAQTQAQAEDMHSPNMRLLANVPGVTNPASGVSFTNSDLAFWGNLAFAGDYGGFRIFDISNPSNPRLVADHRCNGPQNDVSVWGGLLFQSIDTPQTTSDCNSRSTNHTATPGAFEGIRIFDVSNPESPFLVKGVQTDCGSHTHTLVPDPRRNRVLIYVSSYALTPGSLGPDCKNDNVAAGIKGHNKISIVEVPLSNPAAARVIAEPALDPGTKPLIAEDVLPGFGLLDTTGCHDITVFMELRLAAAACLSEGQIWDISNLERPRFLQRIDEKDENGKNVVELYHNAAFTWDGKVVAFGDEAGGGVLAKCRATDSPKVGAVWFYRVSRRKPLERLGTFKIPRFTNEHCTSHNFNFIPLKGRYILAHAWYAAGTSVIDATNPASAQEIGFYQPMHPNASWSSYWYRGRIYSNDIDRGFDVFKIDDRRVRGAAKFAFDNPQTQMRLLDDDDDEDDGDRGGGRDDDD